MRRQLTRLPFLLIALFLLQHEPPPILFAQQPDAWPIWVADKHGYAIAYPSHLPPQESLPSGELTGFGIASQLHFGEWITLVVRRPGFSDEAFSHFTAGWETRSLASGQGVQRQEQIVYPQSPEGTSSRTIQYAVHGSQADYLLSYTASQNEVEHRQIFERMVDSFLVLPTDASPSAPEDEPATVSTLDVTDGFDFPVDPRDGSSGRPPSYASYNVRNPYLNNSTLAKSGCVSGQRDKRTDQVRWK